MKASATALYQPYAVLLAVSGGLARGENGGAWLDEHEDC